MLSNRSSLENDMKVFLSSTVSDLAEYRTAVTNMLSGLNVQCVTSESIPAGACISEVIQSEIAAADAVVVILGYRYGSIDTETGKSWVEWEIEIARRLEKPVLVFLSSENTRLSAGEIDVNRAMVEQLRQTLMANYTFRRFSTPSDLAISVIESLSWLSHKKTAPSEDATTLTRTRSIKVIRLLLSSPGDVVDERESYVRAVFRFNQQEVERNGLFVKVIRWEDMAPQIGPGPQNVINRQIGKYDIFVGIMWNRFGTPTDIASSGTEEEFRGAVDSWRLERKPWIIFYFCDRAVNFTNEDQLDQKAKVLRFRTKLQQMGLVRNFFAPDDLERLAFENLLRITSQADFLKSIE